MSKMPKFAIESMTGEGHLCILVLDGSDEPRPLPSPFAFDMKPGHALWPYVEAVAKAKTNAKWYQSGEFRGASYWGKDGDPNADAARALKACKSVTKTDLVINSMRVVKS